MSHFESFFSSSNSLSSFIKRKWDKYWPLAIIIILAGLFFVRFAHLTLNSDDVEWLAGHTSTNFDRYRLLPLLFFQAIHAIMGSSPVAALGMSFFFHTLNILLVYFLSRRLLAGPTGPLAAAWVFAVNPLTLGTLTWFSCFSYIIGTTLGLAACLCCLRITEEKRPTLWAGLTIGFYLLSLFCCHELLFLPVVLLACGWRSGQGMKYRFAVLFLATSFIGLAANQWYYRFTELDVNPNDLLTFRFMLAGLSSVFSYGLAMYIAYPLSFFGSQVSLLQALLAEPIRWLLTAVIAFVLPFCLRRQTWRPILATMAAFSALIAPYILRLFLMPEGGYYAPEYILSGRVFYIPFTALSLAWGLTIQQLVQADRRRQYFTALAALFGIVWALLIAYQPTDFQGLNMMIGGSGSSLPPPENWNPYQQVTLAGLAWAAIALIAAMLIRIRAKWFSR